MIAEYFDRETTFGADIIYESHGPLLRTTRSNRTTSTTRTSHTDGISRTTESSRGTGTSDRTGMARFVLGSGTCTFSDVSYLGHPIFSAPAGHRTVATGGARRNPWCGLFDASSAPEGRRGYHCAIEINLRVIPQPLPGLPCPRHRFPRVPHRRAAPARCSTRGYSPMPLSGQVAAAYDLMTGVSESNAAMAVSKAIASNSNAVTLVSKARESASGHHALIVANVSSIFTPFAASDWMILSSSPGSRPMSSGGNTPGLLNSPLAIRRAMVVFG